MPNIKCSGTTKSGQPCQSWAVHHSDPPLCSAHLGRNRGAGAPVSNQNRLTHGFYSPTFTLKEIADILASADVPALTAEILAAQVAVRRVLEYLENNGGLNDKDFQASIALVFTGTSTIGRLLRSQRSLTGLASEEIAEAIATALDQLSIELGLDL